MAEIKLTKGKVAIVDDADFAWLSQWKWHYSTSGYATRTDWNNGKPKAILMHRLILLAPVEKIVDHINQNKLDNRRVNLRETNKSFNSFNSKIFSTNTSGFRGIYFDKKIKKYRVRIQEGIKTLSFGCFDKIHEALYVRNKIYQERGISL